MFAAQLHRCHCFIPADSRPNLLSNKSKEPLKMVLILIADSCYVALGHIVVVSYLFLCVVEHIIQLAW